MGSVPIWALLLVHLVLVLLGLLRVALRLLVGLLLVALRLLGGLLVLLVHLLRALICGCGGSLGERGQRKAGGDEDGDQTGHGSSFRVEKDRRSSRRIGGRSIVYRDLGGRILHRAVVCQGYPFTDRDVGRRGVEVLHRAVVHADRDPLGRARHARAGGGGSRQVDDLVDA